MGLITVKSGEVVFLPLLMLLVIIGLVGITHRFWCRYLCPLGAFYAILARFSLFRRRRSGCDDCKEQERCECQAACSMGTSPNKQCSPDECIRCMNCEGLCHSHSISFSPALPVPSTRENLVSLDRRTFVASMAIGAVGGLSAVQARAGDKQNWQVVRPPTVTDELIFTALCVRCGQCMRSCPTGTLQPLFLQSGFAGLWTPAITPRVGGCKDSCNACSIACLTGAIPSFGPFRPDKWPTKMGQVTFNSTRCISNLPGAVKSCLKCVEVCPNKAIVVDFEARPERPIEVIYSRCIGCGLCETQCRNMVIGPPALTLTSHGVGTPTVLVADPKPKLPQDFKPSNKDKT